MTNLKTPLYVSRLLSCARPVHVGNGSHFLSGYEWLQTRDTKSYS